MEEILKTEMLEFDKSTFLIDLVQLNKGKQFIRITQIINNDLSSDKKIININPSVLSDILKVLKAYQDIIPGGDDKRPSLIPSLKYSKVNQRPITESAKLEIQNRYLKGVSIREISIQFNCKVELIEQVLRNNNIEIVENQLPRSFRYKKFRKR